MICPRCHHSNEEVDVFCRECGNRLVNVQQEPTLAYHPISQREASLIGRVIDKRYKIESQIGIGGMGTVYRGTRLLIGDEVAIKVLHQDKISSDPQAAERFHREAQSAARLKHPNAVSVYDFGISADGLQYLVTELIEGQSLRQMMKEKGTLSAPVAAEIIAQVCAALDEAHRQNVIHRDIKPDNIMVYTGASGLRVKVLDFGIAKLRDSSVTNLTQTGSVMGTPHYMSPEQCIDGELDSSSDMYSLGIVLYEMLTGVVPFDAPNSMAVIIQHVNQAPPPLRNINTTISPAVEAFVLRALEKRREARPQTATAFAREFGAAVHAVSTVEQPKVTLKSPALNATPPGGVDPTLVVGPPPSGPPFIAPGAAAPFTTSTNGSSNSARTVLITAVATILVLSLVGGIAWLLLRDQTHSEMTRNAETSSSSNQNNSTQSNVTVPANTSNKATVNSNPSPSPSPSPTPTPVDTALAESEVRSAMSAWADSLRRRDLNANMSLYADRLNKFYNKSGISKDEVRKARQKNFDEHPSIDVRLSNVRVTVDPSSGTTATVLYDNTYNWIGVTRSQSTSGTSHNRITMSKIGGRWLITSEVDLG